MATMETLQFNCTTCPSECLLTVSVSTDDQTGERRVEVAGNRCKRGRAFGTQEVTRPMRVLASTVQVTGGDERLLPVRTAEAIPRDQHFAAMGVIRQTAVAAPVRMGDVIIPDLLGTGVDLVASMDVAAI